MKSPLVRPLCAVLLALLAGGSTRTVRAQNGFDFPATPAAATVNLATSDGVSLMHGQWRYSDTKIIETDFKDGAGHPDKTYDYTPHAGGAGFDDAAWEILPPESLGKPRSTGRLCFNWYRINLTIPDKVGDFATAGSTVVFEITIDDYAEIWVDGKLPRKVGQQGGSVIHGFNAPNRLAITTDAQPGQKIELAVFGINGPLSAAPDNWIFIRGTKLDFYKKPDAAAADSDRAVK